MKQGTNFILPVTIGCDISDATKIEFLFEQGERKLLFTYPSSTAALDLDKDNTVDLTWTREQTYIFAPNSKIKMDTRITFSESDENPETNIVEVTMSPTLFSKEEVDSE